MSISCPCCGGGATQNGHRLGGHAIVACTCCSLRFAPTAWGLPVNYDQVYESPEYVSTQLDALADDFDPAQFVQHGTYRKFFEQVTCPENGTLLDLGCGAGRFCYGAHHLGWRVMGADVSDKAVAFKQGNAPFRLRRATAAELLEEPERFDAVTAFEVLEHLEDPRAFLVQAMNLTRPGGVVFCTVPNWDCDLVQHATRPDWIPPVHLNFFTQQALQRVAELAGFAVVKTGLIFTEAPRLSWKRRLLRFDVRQPSSAGTALGIWLLARNTKKQCG